MRPSLLRADRRRAAPRGRRGSRVLVLAAWALTACGAEDLPPDPSAPLTSPREPRALARGPVRDVPFVQERNLLPAEGSADRAELVGLVWPPASFGAAWRRPLPITPRGLRATEAPRALDLGAPLVAAAAHPTHLLLASRRHVYAVDGEARVVATATVSADVLGVDEDGVVLTSSGALAFEPGTGQLGPLSPGVRARARHGALACEVTDTTLRCARGEAAPEVHALPAAVGRPRALGVDVALPAALRAVVFGDGGVAALGAEGWEDVPLLRAGRVPYTTIHGVVRLDDGSFVAFGPHGAQRPRPDGEWRVYNAQRWIVSPDVRAVVEHEGVLWLASTGGLSAVEATTTTLEQKLAPFVTRIVERHDRDGAVADSHLTTRGDLSTNIPWDSDNDGSWTSYWIRGECYRYKVTGDPAAKAHFDRSLDAMLALRDLTGTDHFVARAVIRKAGCRLDDCDAPDDGQWFTSPDGQWWVKGDTSNDEVVAHMSIMGMAYDVCADEAQKVRIRAHVAGIVRGIVEHGWQLVDLDGLVTTYGQYDPAYAKVSLPGMLGDGGVRALELLSSLTLAHYLTGDVYFYDAKRRLIDEHGYDTMTEGELDYPFRKTNMDNDEMAVWSWMLLLRYESDPALHARWLGAWEHNWRRKFVQQQGAWWILVHAYVGGAEVPLEQALRWLVRAPVDMVRWNVVNSPRRDLVEADPEWFDNGVLRSDGLIIPYEERPLDRWNTHQFRADSETFDGRVEMDGADVLEPYWKARYYGWITP